MITLKEALIKSNAEMATLRVELEATAKESGLNAYVGFESSGEGVPILIKDNIQVKDWSVTSGSKILQGYIAPYEATVITNLKSKGMMAFGRANMDEFAMGSTTESSFYGVTKNPHGDNRVPGGSSGGSAAAVLWWHCYRSTWVRYWRVYPSAGSVLWCGRYEANVWKSKPLWSRCICFKP